MLGHRQLTFGDYMAILRRRRRLIIMPIVLLPILAYAVSLILPKQYTSEATILIEDPAIPQSYVASMDPGDLKQRLASIQQQILSRTRLAGVIEKLGLYPEERGKVSMDDLADRLGRKIVVTPVKPMLQVNNPQLPGFTLQAKAPTPAMAQKICDEVADMFLNSNLHLREEQAQDTTAFLTKQLADAKAKLDEQDAKLAAFKSQYMGSLPDNEQANLSILNGLNSQLEATTQALNRAAQDKTFAESMLSQQLAALQSSQGGSDPQSLQKELADEQAQLASMQTKYTEDHPDMIRLRASIADLQKKIAENAKAPQSQSTPTQNTASMLAENQGIVQLRAQVHQYDASIRQLTAQQHDVQRQIGLYQSRIQLSPNVEEQYKILTRDYTSAADFYNDLLKKRTESAMLTDLHQQKNTDHFRVLDPPTLPSGPSFPIPLYFALAGLGLGIVAGVSLALLREARDTTLRTEKDVELLLQVPTLVLIPSADGQRNGHALPAPRTVHENSILGAN
jgi:polysaccharide chain length determinant protein (PEP-CTERM system associated)